MKELEILLKKYADGTLSSDEKDELNLLTHRENIVAHASKQASAARRRRIVGMTTAASLMIVIATSLTFYQYFSPSDSSSTPLVAQQTTTILPTTQETYETITTPLVEDNPTTITERTVSASQAFGKANLSIPTDTKTAPVIVEEVVPSNTEAPNQVVACNTQCSPDSVINDIWRFLQV